MEIKLNLVGYFICESLDKKKTTIFNNFGKKEALLTNNTITGHC